MKENVIERELLKGAPSSVVLVRELVEDAARRKASDIHLEPVREGILVRYRIDGILEEVYRVPRILCTEVIARIKVLAGLRTDEHYAPQDGRFRMTLSSGAHLDVRVSTVPTYYGENAVLRLLRQETQAHKLEALGFSAKDQEIVGRALARGSGMILATGPTGSGKTTTLYSLIQELPIKERALVTIEDPIEYAMEGVRQIQVQSKVGLTFSNGLRTVLRQDPDVIMVGEIRDLETAGVAVHTALSGHLLLSTLHTNDAATAVPRLLDMKVEPFLVASTVSLVIAQRLVRKICESCEHKNREECASCGGSGYKGRVSIAELFEPDEEIRKAILSRAEARELKRLAVSKGMRTMYEDGLEKVRAGLTTLEEVLRVIHD